MQNPPQGCSHKGDIMKWLMAAALAAALASPVAALAQKKTYKCGAVFQDRPCEGAAPAAPKAAPPPPAPAKTTSAADLEARKQIRCENWGRQVSELRDRERGETSADVAKGIA